MKPVRTIDVLRAARKRIDDKSRWTRLVPARDRVGIPVDADDESARSWCVLGAVNADTPDSVRGHESTWRLTGALRIIAVRLGYDTIGAANDLGGHAVALSILDAAIAELEASQ